MSKEFENLLKESEQIREALIDIQAQMTSEA